MKTIAGRRRSIGLAGAALWLVAISLVFVIWSLVAIGTPVAKGALVGTIVLAAAFVVADVAVIRAARSLPVSTAPRSEGEQRMGRQFALVFGAEMVAFAVVNSIIGATGNYELMPSLNLIVVGIHFIPLARIFRVPRYFTTGILFCAISIVTLLVIPKQFPVGDALAWYVVPSLGCGLVASVAAAAGLREAWRDIVIIRGAA